MRTFILLCVVALLVIQVNARRGGPGMGKGKGPKAPKDEACIEKCGQETCKDDPCHMCVTTNCANMRPGPRKGCMRRNCSEVCTEGKESCMPTCVRECPNKEE